MGDISSENIRIPKLKGTENWTSWYDDIESTLVLRDLWKYASGQEVEPLSPTEPEPVAGSSSSDVDATAQEKYQKETVVYDTNTRKWSRSHQKIMAIIRLTCEPGPRIHLTNITNAYKALAILRNLYGGSDLSTIDISYREINRSNLESFPNIEAYAQHLKAHREKIIQAGENLKD